MWQVKSIRFILAVCLLIGTNVYSQEKPLTSEELQQEKFYKSYYKALEEPEKVYKISIVASRDNEKLNEVLNKCKNLQNIDLLDCQLTAIPNEIFELKYLQYLFLNHNKISEIPEEIKNLNYLKILSIKFNNLKEIPEYLSELKNLELLMLRGNNIPEADIENLKLLLPDCKVLF